MHNYRILLQYEGTRYRGWQKQEGTQDTIQGKLETLLSKMAGETVEVQASGRTDAGVHALGQVANFHVSKAYDPEEIKTYMNTYLPEDIAVIKAEHASERFHSRLNATGKTYCYRVINSRTPHVFDRKYTYTVEEPLDVEAMRKAAGYFLGTHDFAGFTSTKKGKKSSVREIEEITIEKKFSSSLHGQMDADELVFTYKGNGFLYHMVRIMTGTLLEVGRGLREPDDILRILDSGNRQDAGALVPAKGLTLMEVRYS